MMSRNGVTVFNTWYYAFSPSVAGLIAQQLVLKIIMNGILYPFKGILHLSSMTYSAFSFSPGFGFLMAWLVATASICVIYFSLPVMVLIPIIERLRKKKLRVRKLKLVAILWMMSVALFILFTSFVGVKSRF